MDREICGQESWRKSGIRGKSTMTQMGLGEVKRQKNEKELYNIQRAKSKVGGTSRKPLLCEIQPSVSQARRSTWTK